MNGMNVPLVVITGGSRGIGDRLVQSFVRRVDVLNISRTRAQKSSDSRCELYNLCLDLSQMECIEPRLRAWFDAHPQYVVATLMHNAAVLNLGRLDAVKQESLENSFRVNVYAPLTITNVVAGSKRFAQDGARVLYVVSSLGRLSEELSFSGLGLYSMTKAALGKLALVQRREFEQAMPSVKVLRIHPGIVDTDLQNELRTARAIDPAFGVKTSLLPPYREGEWNGRSPGENMRTISPDFAAEFIAWAAESSQVSAEEYDFYHCTQFHADRVNGRSRKIAPEDSF
jgi:NAD(P)-dependent dehydrogenase (short-subunit alcohol dehydrogenase family)